MTLKTGTVYATAIVGAAATLLIAAPQKAAAHPAYAQKTGQVCGVCHVNPKGGGTLTKTGIKWVTGGMKAKVKK
jgi:mono/diheme cytochrome c family protein